MKPKFTTHLALAVCLTVSFLFSSQVVFAQNDTCCTEPDSMHVILVTDSMFCVGWHIPTHPNCHAPIKVTIQWKPVDSTTWLIGHITYNPGTTDTFFCSAGTAGTKYQWRLKHTCKDSAGAIILTGWVKGPNFTLHTHFARNNFSGSEDAVYSDGKGLTNNERLMTRLYPNPSANMVTVEGYNKTGGSMKVVIVNVAGQQVYTQSISTTPGNYRHSINISALSSGTYFIKVSNGTTSSVSKLIRQ